MKKLAVIAVIVALATLSGSFSLPAIGQDTKPAASKAAPAPSPAPSTKVDADFIKEYEQLVALQGLINQIEQENGLVTMRKKFQDIATDLQKRVPAGMNFDPEKKEFVKTPEPPKPAAK